MEQQKGDQPFETGYGMWAKYGPAPSALLCNCSSFLCLTHVGTEGCSATSRKTFDDRRNRLPASAFDDLRTALRNSKHVLEEAPVTVDVVRAMRQIPRDAVPDMPDRIIAATAVYLSVPLISRDGRIRASNVQTVW